MDITKELRQDIGKRVKELRKATGVSQEVVAAILNITRTSVCNIETGRQGITAENVVTMCQLFKCMPNDIFPKIDNIDFTVEVKEETIMVPMKKKVFKITHSNNK
jgi:transcriptional regulator with XRE-family HTH domain